MNVMLTNTRTPTETRPPRMEPLARLPVFLALKDSAPSSPAARAAAAWKAELLSAAGARSKFTPPNRARRCWRSRPIRRVARSSSIAAPGPATTFAAPRSPSAPATTTTRRRASPPPPARRGVPVNVIDKPKFCDFAFGAIVNRSPLVIGISTDGAAPVFGQAIRAKLEALIPRGFAQWAEAARRWRERREGVRPVVQRPAAILAALHRASRSPTRIRRPSKPTTTGCCGDDARQARRADTGLGHAGRRRPRRSGAADAARGARAAIRRRHPVRRSGVARSPRFRAARGEEDAGRQDRPWPSCKQDEINALMVGLAKAGRRVVRLKGGDPMIFGRAGEEIAACRKAGIAVEVVPGITAAQGAASRLGVSLTQRKAARRRAIRHRPRRRRRAAARSRLAEPRRSVRDDSDLHAGEDARRIRGARHHGGLDPATPAVAVARATRPDEARVVSTIAELPDRLAEAGLPGPGRGDDRPDVRRLAAASAKDNERPQDAALRHSPR